MSQVPDNVLNEMLKQLPKEQQKTLANIISGKITHQVHCNGEDTYVTVNEAELDDDGKPYRDDEGQLKTHPVEQLARQGCKGAVIAYFFQDGLDNATGDPKYRIEPKTGADGSMKLRASRKRLDGFYGFQCWCGNDSRIAAQEAGSIGYSGHPPTREGLETIYAALQKSRPNYPELNGSCEVDGFTIETVA